MAQENSNAPKFKMSVRGVGCSVDGDISTPEQLAAWMAVVRDNNAFDYAHTSEVNRENVRSVLASILRFLKRLLEYTKLYPSK